MFIVIDMETDASSSYITLAGQDGNAPATLYPMQQMLAPYADALTSFWLAVWLTTAGVVLARLVQEYRTRDKDRP